MAATITCYDSLEYLCIDDFLRPSHSYLLFLSRLAHVKVSLARLPSFPLSSDAELSGPRLAFLIFNHIEPSIFRRVRFSPTPFEYPATGRYQRSYRSHRSHKVSDITALLISTSSPVQSASNGRAQLNNNQKIGSEATCAHFPEHAIFS